MSRGKQLRDASGRYANSLGQAMDSILRSGADMHARTFLDDPAPLSWMTAAETGREGDSYLYAAAVRAVIRWRARERPRRCVEIEYVDPAREHIVVREVPGRVGCDGDRARVTAVEWDAAPRRIAVADDEREPLDADSDEHAAYGDALRAHETFRAERGDGR